MELTDAELEELHQFLENEVFYGDDNVVYGEDGDILRSVYHKVNDEAKKRNFWWAR